MTSGIRTTCTTAFAALLAACALSGCASFEDRTKTAHTEIEASFAKLGYTPRDCIEYKSTPRTIRDRTWMERQMRFLDHCDRDWQGLTRFFRGNVSKNDACFSFEHLLVIGESESDLQKIRWYEFKLDNLYTVYRVEFVREATRGAAGRGTPLEIKETTSTPGQPPRPLGNPPTGTRSP